METKLTLTKTSELQAVYKILLTAYEQSKFPIGSPWSLRQLQSYLQQQSLFTLWHQNELVGFICGLKIEAQTFEILMLALRPESWGQGVMRAGVLQLLQQFKEVWLEVHEYNTPAIQLYLDMGFKITGQRLKYYQNDGTALVMSYKKS